MIPGEWRRDSYDKTGLVNIRRADSNNHFRDVCQIRTRFKEYLKKRRGTRLGMVYGLEKVLTYLSQLKIQIYSDKLLGYSCESYYTKQKETTKSKSSKVTRYTRAATRSCFFSENMQWIYRETASQKCNFKKFEMHPCWNYTFASVFYCKFHSYLQNNFFKEHL